MGLCQILYVFAYQNSAHVSKSNTYSTQLMGSIGPYHLRVMVQSGPCRDSGHIILLEL